MKRVKKRKNRRNGHPAAAYGVKGASYLLKILPPVRMENDALKRDTMKKNDSSTFCEKREVAGTPVLSSQNPA